MSVVGIDGCKRGWFVVALANDGTARGHLARRLDDVLARVPDARGVGIDIPIGLPRRGPRQADLEARRLLGPRRSSVFLTPVRKVLEAPTHAEASYLSRELEGHGLSRQTYALADKILEADRWAATMPFPVWEVHPEVSFAVLLGHPARRTKRSWCGLRERQEALDAAGIDLATIGEAGGRAAPDDVVDAAVCAWSAARLVRGRGLSLPDPPEAGSDTGRPMAIWA